MPRIRRTLALALALAFGAPLGPAPAWADEGWQYHLAQANSFYRNKLLPKALAELKLVVEDPEGGKQLKAWQLIIDISTKLKDLDSLIWALEKGRAVAEGQEAAQMQAQLYRLSRAYGRVVFTTTGGSGKLPTKSVKLKALDEIGDPEAKAYYEKARAAFQELGLSKGSYYLPAGRYDLDGDELKITGGKDVTIEVAPTTTASFALMISGIAGARAGTSQFGADGFLGGLDLTVGPHIQFASGNSLVVRVGPQILFGSQATADIQQNIWEADERARLGLGGIARVGFEFRVGPIDLSPHVGYLLQSLPSGLYYKGTVSTQSADPNVPSSMLEGEFVVPALGHGPRVGIEALLTPALVKGKRRPRLFVGIQGGPTWVRPLWGEAAEGGSLGPSSGLTVRDEGNSGLGEGPFTVKSILAGDEAGNARIYGDIQGVFGVQVRL